MRWTPHVTVAAIIARAERFLVVEERVGGGLLVFNQPAGHLEEGEDLPAAVRREVLEETAHDFSPQGLVGVYLHPSSEAGVCYVRFCFHGQLGRQHHGRALDEGILRTVWLTQDELRRHSARLRSPLVLRCLDDYLAGRHWPLDVLRYVPLPAAAHRPAPAAPSPAPPRGDEDG